jgi:1-aminocyclopropane-1-carboxylate deaminase
LKVPIEEIHFALLEEKKVSLYIKREDLLHPQISGNKYRKLKYNAVEAEQKGFDTLLTFGGAFSNHIAATAYAGKLSGLKTIGVIRGEELLDKWQDNPTLRLAFENGMQFHFVSREAYRQKEQASFQKELKKKFGSFYVLPEGGTNTLAIKGCEEILNDDTFVFDYICVSVGTGGTLAGVINAAHEKQHVLGFPALKGDFLKEDIRNFVRKENWDLTTGYHFGGYAKVSEELISFVNDFKRKTQIPLDLVYTGKLMYGIFDMLKTNQFEPNSKILVIHTGGLQGNAGMNQKLKKKNLPLIEL